MIGVEISLSNDQVTALTAGDIVTLPKGDMSKLQKQLRSQGMGIGYIQIFDGADNSYFVSYGKYSGVAGNTVEPVLLRGDSRFAAYDLTLQAAVTGAVLDPVRVQLGVCNLDEPTSFDRGDYLIKLSHVSTTTVSTNVYDVVLRFSIPKSTMSSLNRYANLHIFGITPTPTVSLIQFDNGDKVLDSTFDLVTGNNVTESRPFNNKTYLGAGRMTTGNVTIRVSYSGAASNLATAVYALILRYGTNVTT